MPEGIVNSPVEVLYPLAIFHFQELQITIVIVLCEIVWAADNVAQKATSESGAEANSSVPADDPLLKYCFAEPFDAGNVKVLEPAAAGGVNSV